LLFILRRHVHCYIDRYYLVDSCLSHPSRLTLGHPSPTTACPEKTGRGAWEVKKYHRRKGENFLARHSIDGPGKAGGRKGGIIEYNLIEPRVSTPLNRA